MAATDLEGELLSPLMILLTHCSLIAAAIRSGNKIMSITRSVIKKSIIWTPCTHVFMGDLVELGESREKEANYNKVNKLLYEAKRQTVTWKRKVWGGGI